MQNLSALLKRLTNNSYKLYKSLDGPYQFPDFQLKFDSIQGDPFASPSKITVYVPLKKTGFPPNIYETPVRSIAFRDALSRVIAKNIRKLTSCNRGTGKSGLITINWGGQKVLDRNSVVIRNGQVIIRLMVGLPAYGRKIAAEQAEAMFLKEIPEVIRESCFWNRLDSKYFNAFVNLSEKQEFIRHQLKEKNLIAFVADGSVLPRKSGVLDTSLHDAVKFRSPESLTASVILPSGEIITGMGIRKGITLITGGGFHGKSTLLNAIQSGIYNHIPGDGREYVISTRETVKIRAEDGRSVTGADISTFINNLPGNRPTQTFTTENASGSTSQAANIMESLESGARVLLMDEDTSATNFLIRDKRMQELIPAAKEPITPFIDVARALLEEKGVSTVIAVGGSGDYIDIADTVIMMDEYHAIDATFRAKNIAAKYPNSHIRDFNRRISIPRRRPDPASVNASKGKRDAKISAFDTGILFGKERIELAGWEQIAERTQYETIGDILHYMVKKGYIDGNNTVSQAVNHVFDDIRARGLDVIFQECFRCWNYYCEVRKTDITAALNRLRSLKVK